MKVFMTIKELNMQSLCWNKMFVILKERIVIEGTHMDKSQIVYSGRRIVGTLLRIGLVRSI